MLALHRKQTGQEGLCADSGEGRDENEKRLGRPDQKGAVHSRRDDEKLSRSTKDRRKRYGASFLLLVGKDEKGARCFVAVGRRDRRVGFPEVRLKASRPPVLREGHLKRDDKEKNRRRCKTSAAEKSAYCTNKTGQGVSTQKCIARRNVSEGISQREASEGDRFEARGPRCSSLYDCLCVQGCKNNRFSVFLMSDHGHSCASFPPIAPERRAERGIGMRWDIDAYLPPEEWLSFPRLNSTLPTDSKE